MVSRSQLTDLGLGRRAIGHRLESGRLHSIHRGVYAVGHPMLSPDGRRIAAVLACGPDAVLSHRSAAALWGLRRTSESRIDVTTPRAIRPRQAIRTHEAPVPPDEQTTVRGIPVTSPSRTLLDLAEGAGPRELERAFAEAEALRLTGELSLSALIPRHRGRHGLRALHQLLRRARPPALTRSRLEERFLHFVDSHGMPSPEANTMLHLGDGLVEVDCLWRSARVVAELDGFAYHAGREAFHRDRARDRALQAAGWRVIRVTWRDLEERHGPLAAELRTLLAGARRPSGPMTRAPAARSPP